jgi:hypothetical protein
MNRDKKRVTSFGYPFWELIVFFLSLKLFDRQSSEIIIILLADRPQKDFGSNASSSLTSRKSGGVGVNVVVGVCKSPQPANNTNTVAKKHNRRSMSPSFDDR